MPKKTNFNDLIRIMARLRSPGGCPWDREQTHESLVRYLKEESRETVAAIRKKDWLNLEEELGDILLQVLFHAQLAGERGDFSIHDVLETLRSKLVGRHPHVFGKKRGDIVTAQDVKDKWKELKKKEQAERMARRLKKTRA